MNKAISLASEVAFQAEARGLSRAIGNYTREMHGRGCGCNTCRLRTIRDVEQWVDFVSVGSQRFVNGRVEEVPLPQRPIWKEDRYIKKP